MVCDPFCPIDCNGFEPRMDSRSDWTASKELLGFRFSTSSDVLLVGASVSTMLRLTSFVYFSLFLPFDAFNDFKLLSSFAPVLGDIFAIGVLVFWCWFSSEPDSLSPFRNGFVSSLLPLDVDDVAIRPSSSELMSAGETCVWTPRNQLGCLKMWTVDPHRK